MDELLTDFQRRGYRFVSLDEATTHPAYATPDHYTGPKGLSWLQRWTVVKGLPLEGDGQPKTPNLSELLGPDLN